MITTADAVKVMKHVAACHHRTAPRLDDREAVLVTAGIWAELFNVHRLLLDDLLAAVKRRALSESVAPEPAEIIKVARDIRNERDAKRGPSAEYEALCNTKAGDAESLARIVARTGQTFGREIGEAS